MQLKNNKAGYGFVSIAIHWLMAITLIGLYFSGDYMVGLDYYSTLYHTLPDIHKAVGVIVGFLLIFRIVWLHTHTRPENLPDISNLNHLLAKLGHIALYILMIVMLVSGYMISTAKGAGIDVFGIFELPALLAPNDARADFAGEVHEIAGLVFMLVVLGHAAAALIHHFFMKDNTLRRMFGYSTEPKN